METKRVHRLRLGALGIGLATELSPHIFLPFFMKGGQMNSDPDRQQEIEIYLDEVSSWEDIYPLSRWQKLTLDSRLAHYIDKFLSNLWDRLKGHKNLPF